MLGRPVFLANGRYGLPDRLIHFSVIWAEWRSLAPAAEEMRAFDSRTGIDWKPPCLPCHGIREGRLWVWLPEQDSNLRPLD